MKLSEIKKLKSIFVKKGRGVDTKTQFIILGFSLSNSGKTVYIHLDCGRKFKPSDLTDVSCDLMECGNCKYHKRS